MWRARKRPPPRSGPARARPSVPLLSIAQLVRSVSQSVSSLGEITLSTFVCGRVKCDMRIIRRRTMLDTVRQRWVRRSLSYLQPNVKTINFTLRLQLLMHLSSIFLHLHNVFLRLVRKSCESTGPKPNEKSGSDLYTEQGRDRGRLCRVQEWNGTSGVVRPLCNEVE